jgi:hypothetical protein
MIGIKVPTSVRKWHKDTRDGGRINYHLDYRFKRRLAVFGPYAFWESIRVIQKNPGEKVEFMYHRAVGQSETMFTISNRIRLFKNIYKALNFLLKKSFDIDDVRGTKYVYKYPFVGDLFKEVVRNRKLEQLGI